jgi:hypothetical protein
MNKKSLTIVAIELAINIGTIAQGLILAWPIQFLWNNSLAEAVSSINPINIYNSFCLFMLVNLLFYNIIGGISKSNKSENNVMLNKD